MILITNLIKNLIYLLVIIYFYYSIEIIFIKHIGLCTTLALRGWAKMLKIQMNTILKSISKGIRPWLKQRD